MAFGRRFRDVREVKNEMSDRRRSEADRLPREIRLSEVAQLPDEIGFDNELCIRSEVEMLPDEIRLS